MLDKAVIEILQGVRRPDRTPRGEERIVPPEHAVHKALSDIVEELAIASLDHGAAPCGHPGPHLFVCAREPASCYRGSSTISTSSLERRSCPPGTLPREASRLTPPCARPPRPCHSKAPRSPRP